MSTPDLSPPPTGLRIRRATPGDAAMIAALGIDTFTTSFGAQNTPENLAAHLSSAYGPGVQERELADPAYTYLIPELNGQVAGYALIHAGHAPACVTGPSPIEVLRFYVVAELHGAGIAQSLMDACVTEARRRGGRTLWLGVWSLNPRAIRFYEKCGYRQVGTQTFMLGDDPQLDRVLARPI